MSPVEVAALSVPLALFLLLSELEIGGLAVVAYLTVTGGLTRGFLKFIAITYALVAAMALLVVVTGPPSSYRRLLGIDPSAARWLGVLQALVVVALVAHTIAVWRQRPDTKLTWPLSLLASALLLAGIAATLAPLAGSALDVIAIAGAVALSCIVLGAATTGMLLGHWYLVTPALTNRPLLRSIVVLLIGLALQAIAYPFVLGGLSHSSGSLSRPLEVSPVLTILWGLGAVALPLLAGGLALPACRLRSFMSTTGLLYLAMIALIPGQLVGQLLFFVAAST